MSIRGWTSLAHDTVCERQGKVFTRHHLLGSGRWVIDRRRSTESSIRVSGSHFDTLGLGFGDNSWHVGSNICELLICSVPCKFKRQINLHAIWHIKVKIDIFTGLCLLYFTLVGMEIKSSLEIKWRLIRTSSGFFTHLSVDFKIIHTCCIAWIYRNILTIAVLFSWL